MKRKSIYFSLVVLVLLAACTYGFGQTATGEIVGRVADAQSAVIVGAKITVTETATGRVRTATSGSDGGFQMLLLPPGSYTLAAEAPNMAKAVVKVELLLGAHQAVNFTLHPAGTQTTVEVSGEAPDVDTTSSEIKANIDPQQMTELPLNGRTFASLAILAPGVRPASSFDPTKSRIGTVSINGSTGRNFNLTVDGGDNKDNIVGGFLQNYTTEGIQEFVIDTHKFGADTGKSGGGVVTIATKGGSNTLHGGAFFYMRNRNLNANDYFTTHPNTIDPKTGDVVPCPPCYTSALAPGQTVVKAPFDKQNYGGSLSGPIRKDKMYFFAAAEHTHEMSSVAQNGTTLQILRDFVELRKTIPIQNAQLQNLPIDLSASIPVPFLDTQFQGRFDWNVSPRDAIFVRYAQQNNHLANDQVSGWSDISQAGTTTNDLNSILGNWTRTVGSSGVNQFVFQYSHFYNGMFNNKVGENVPEVCFASGPCIGMGENFPQTTTQNKYQFRDDVSWRKGKHTLKFGFQDIYTKDVGGIIAYDVSPWLNMRCDPLDCGPQGLDTPGMAKSSGLGGGNPSYMQHGIHQVSFYFQDDLKLTPRLTLNLGVRNDIDFGLVPTDNQVNNRAVKLLTAIGQKPGLPSTDTNNWAPRLGFAWDVTGKGKWVFRGGYGWYFDQLFTNTILHATQQANPDIYGVIYQVSSYPRAGRTGALGASDALAGIAAAVGGMWPITHAPDLPFGARGRYINPNFQTPYSQQATFGTQLELSKNMTVSVDYVHSLALHEFTAREVNPAVDGSNDSRILNTLMDPIYGCRNPADATISVANCALGGMQHKLHRITQAESGGRSRYDSLTFNLRRRMANHFSFGASYVLARAVGYGGSAFDWGNVGQGIAPGLTGWQTALQGIIGPQNFGYVSGDERHRVVLNGIFELPGGFTISAISQLSSGRPYTMYSDDDNNGDGVVNDVYSNIITGDPVFDPYWAGDSRYSVRSKNQLRGDPYYQTDLRVQKTFKIKERARVTLVADIFNLFNRTNYGNSFQNYADSFGDHQVDTPTTLYDCVGAQGLSFAPPCTFPTARQLPRVPTSLFGGGYGGAGTIGIPFQAQFGLRINF